MTFETLVPNRFYTDLREGLKLFVDCLGFNIGHMVKNPIAFLFVKQVAKNLHKWKECSLAPCFSSPYWPPANQKWTNPPPS